MSDALKWKTDFTVIRKGKRYSVHGRRSIWEDGDWHWQDGWYLRSYGTLERAEAEADALNRMYGEREVRNG